MAHRGYTWSKSDLKTAYTPTSNSKSQDSISSTKKYDNSYSRTKSDAPVNKETPTRTLPIEKIGTSRYTSGSSSYKSTYSPTTYSRDKSTTREKDTSTSTNRYGNYSIDDKSEKSSVLNRYSRPAEKSTDYTSSRLSVNTSRSRDPSPTDKNRYGYTRNLSSLQSNTIDSANRSNKDSKEKSDSSVSEKDAKIKTPSYNNSYNSYKLYSRPLSYNRSILKEDTKIDTPNASRYPSTTNRYGTTYSRISNVDKHISPYTSTSPLTPTEVPKSPSIFNDTVKCNGDVKTETIEVKEKENQIDIPEETSDSEESESDDDSDVSMINVTVVTRGTSPTPPSSSVYLRTRRADMAKTIEKTISRPKKRLKMLDKEMQSDRMDDSTRSSRYGSTARITSPWSSYLDTSRYSSSASTGRYSSGLSGRYYNYSSSRDSNISDKSTTEVKTPTRTSESEPDPTPIKPIEPVISTSKSSELLKNITKSPIKEIVPLIQNGSIEKSVHKEIITPPVTPVKEKAKSPSPSIIPVVDTRQEIPEVSDQLPPQVPKTDSTPLSKSTSSLHSLNKSLKSPGKKMVKKSRTKEDVAKTKVLKRSISSSSGDSETSQISNDSISPTTNNGDIDSSISLTKTKSKTSLLKSKSGSLKKSSSEIGNKNQVAKSQSPKSRSSSSPESSMTTPSSDSSSEEEKKVNAMKNVDPKIVANGSSRTSCLASSADEVSLSYDSSSKPPPNPKLQKSDSQPRTEEAKSFLMRALAPVASLFKMHYQEDRDSDNQNTFNNIPSISNSDSTNNCKFNNIKRVESGNKDWWLDSKSDKSSESDIKRSSSQSDQSKEGFKFKLIKQESGEKAWWLQSNANIPEGIEVRTPSRKGSSDSDRSEQYNVYKIESSEKETNSSDKPKMNGDDNFILNVVRIRHIESGEKAWWLSSNKNIPEGVHYSSESSSDDSSDSEKNDLDEGVTPNESVVTGKYSVPLVLPDDDDDNEPLGDRKSPEGLETPQGEEDITNRRVFSYDSYNPIPNKVVKRNSTSKTMTDYISRHMDIDDILGTSGQLFSPMMERLLAIKTGQQLLDGDISDCEEIDPTQVRIHDSTAQMPVIQKVHSRSSIIDCSNESESHEMSVEEKQTVELKMTRQEMTCRVRYVNDTDPFRCWSETPTPGKSVLHTFSTLLPLTCQLPALHRLLGAPQRLDDSALQVYKDGDYGPYLDLESSLSEQQEELEGFLDNRKNCIVLRTQLSVRVNAIIDKLLNTEGRELRRALFSLKQIFQEDKDLVHEFVQNDGLDCLLRVGAGADQNYQNYILRALGQVMLYVDGMNGVMKHSPSLQWLYTLISSDYRLVVKTTLKLLLVFVEYVDTNCILLINAIKAVDTSQGLPPWSNIINLLKDYEASDTELLIYAMTLINKCLSGITDQETYYSQTDSLKDQGIYDIIKRYISYQTIDLDLKHQLQIYEASMNHQIIDDRNKRQMGDTLHKHQEENDINLGKLGKGFPLHIVNGGNSYTSPSLYSEVSPTTEEPKISSSPIRSPSDVFRENIAASLQKRRERMQRQRELMKEQQELTSIVSKKPSKSIEENGVIDEENLVENHMLFLKKQNTVKDIAGKLSNQNATKALTEENSIISKAIKGLSNCQIKESRSTTDVKTEVKRNNEIEWLNIAKALDRPLIFNSYDFSDLTEEEDDELPSGMEDSVNPPPPPPPFLMPPPNMNIPPPPMCPSAPSVPEMIISAPSQAKTKKTIKLFWREIPQGTRITSSTIWDELGKVKVDESSLEVLFETRTKEIIKKQLEANKNREVIVLDHKRSNAINILLKKLPPTQSIKNAIVNMDSSVLTREGIDKLLAMLPTKDEILKIQEAQVINPSTPLGKAEQFLLTLSSIYELNSRLKLWAFRLDFECFQNEILEAYIDMKQAIEILKVNLTFRKILACILSIGVFLNGSEAKGFQIEYLSKIQEVKDTVHKHSLLHHLCQMVLDQFPDTSDLYSEIGAVTRSSKINYEELSANIDRLETECKNHMGNFKVILKHDSTAIKTKVGDFLHDCAERIIILGLIKRRLFYRFSKFLLWLGVPPHHISETKPSDIFKIISEFALEYRTTRQQLQQQRQRKASHRERSKTRGKMITELNQIHLNESAESELNNILNTENFSKISSNALGRKRKDPEFIRIEKLDRSGNKEDGIEEVFNILLEKSRTRKKERPSKNSQKLQNRSIKRSRTREGIPIEFGLQST